MAHLVLTSVTVTAAGTDLTNHLTSISVEHSAEDVDDTNMGSAGWRERLPGLKDWTATLEFAQDYAASQVDATMFSLVGTEIAFTGKPTSGATSSTNPEYQGQCIVTAYSPISGGVGEKATTNVTLPGTGALTRDTTP